MRIATHVLALLLLTACTGSSPDDTTFSCGEEGATCERFEEFCSANLFTDNDLFDPVYQCRPIPSDCDDPCSCEADELSCHEGATLLECNSDGEVTVTCENT